MPPTPVPNHDTDAVWFGADVELRRVKGLGGGDQGQLAHPIEMSGPALAEDAFGRRTRYLGGDPDREVVRGEQRDGTYTRPPGDQPVPGRCHRQPQRAHRADPCDHYPASAHGRRS